MFSKESPDNPVLVTRGAATYIAQHPGWVDLEDVYTIGAYPLGGYKPQRPEEVRAVKIAEATQRNAPTAGAALVKALKDMGLEKAKIGLDPENLSPPVEVVLRKELPVTTRVRTVKPRSESRSPIRSLRRLLSEKLSNPTLFSSLPRS